MKKQTAIEAFGSVKLMAAALGCTIYAVYMMPDVLNQKATDRVMGAALRLGVVIK